MHPLCGQVALLPDSILSLSQKRREQAAVDGPWAMLEGQDGGAGRGEGPQGTSPPAYGSSFPFTVSGSLAVSEAEKFEE